MNNVLLPATAGWPLAWPARAWRRQAVALSVALLLHGLAFTALLSHWQSAPPAEPQVRTLTTQLFSLATPVVPAPALPVAPAALPEPAAVVPARVEPALAKAPLEQAKLARKRQEQQRAEKLEQQREQLQAERQRDDQQRAA
ncbi:MAG: energy transducer TonB, partial [Pseudomonadaceae bacterium]|nr:energy transducer TonB [Pseudomonadaceae bacterium]